MFGCFNSWQKYVTILFITRKHWNIISILPSEWRSHGLCPPYHTWFLESRSLWPPATLLYIFFIPTQLLIIPHFVFLGDMHVSLCYMRLYPKFFPTHMIQWSSSWMGPHPWASVARWEVRTKREEGKEGREARPAACERYEVSNPTTSQGVEKRREKELTNWFT